MNRLTLSTRESRIYVTASLFLALAPVWLMLWINAESDGFSSSGDVFGWFGLVIAFLGVNVILQTGILILPGRIPVGLKSATILLSALVWGGSMVLAHLIGIR